MVLARRRRAVAEAVVARFRRSEACSTRPERWRPLNHVWRACKKMVQRSWRTPGVAGSVHTVTENTQRFSSSPATVESFTSEFVRQLRYEQGVDLGFASSDD